MDPATLSALLFALEEAIKLAPTVGADLETIFAGGQPTAADWAALRAKVLGKSYASYDPKPLPSPSPAAVAEAIPATTQPPASTAAASPQSAPAPAANPVQPVQESSLSQPAPAAAPLGTAAPVPGNVAAPAAPVAAQPAPAPALTFPSDLASLNAMVSAATPEQLTWLYQGSGMLADLVNKRWHQNSAPKAG